MTADHRRVWLITGASSGFGRELAQAALDSGEAVVAVARRAERLDRIANDQLVAVVADVTSAEDRERAVQTALNRFGRIDVLVNAAGRTHVGAVEEATDAELRELLELHLVAPAALTRAVLPIMRSQHSGAIVQFSSIAGQIARAGFGAYAASKFALEGLSEAMADEVASFGIRVLIVEPGAFRTSLFTPGAVHQSAPLEAYAGIVGPTRDYVRRTAANQPGDPAKAALAIRHALDAVNSPLRLALGRSAIARLEQRLRDRQQELDAWAQLGQSTAHEESTSETRLRPRDEPQ